jgi:rSAM/selenodomain-associated transferase 2/rSAM/selenodomain-associated transferase 1
VSAAGLRVLVMARAPVAGRVKTRLQPVFTAAECAAIQAALIERTVRWAVEVAGGGVVVAHDGPLGAGGLDLVEAARGVDLVEAPGRLALIEQHGDDLGERLARATRRAFEDHDGPLIVVGTDTRLTPQHADDAREHLEAGADVVFGPALDGGYYLVALKRPAQAVFELEPTLWGGRAVLAHSVEAAERAGLDVRLLDRRERDLDTPEDAEALADHDPEIGPLLRRTLRTPLVSVVVPTLDERAALPTLLDHLARLDGRFEAIVVDGGSRDGTAELAKAHPLAPAVVHQSGGRAAQMNAGARRATGDPIVFLHADTRLPENAHTALTTTTAAGGNFELRFDGSGRFERVLTAWYRAQRRLGVYYGDSAIWLTRQAFDTLDGFAAIPIMEDYELARRLEHEPGLRTACLPGPATTSARRWRTLGIPRTVLSWVAIRWLFLAGVSPRGLARLYRKAR